MKILFIPRWYPGRTDPLNGVFIQRHALSAALKHQVAVLYVSADPGMKDAMYDMQYTVEEGIATVRVYYNNSLLNIPLVSSLIKFYRYMQSSRMGTRMMNEKFGIPDICHIHVLARTFFLARYYKYFYKIPFIVSEQWSGYLPEDAAYKGLLKKLLTKKAVKTASAVTTVSDSLKNAMLAQGLKNNYTVIPNVVDTKTFHPSEQHLKNPKYIFLHVSNLVDRAKNVSGMIRAIKKLAEMRNDFEFHIVGDGGQRKELEVLSKNLDLFNKTVFFLGIKKITEVAEMMRKADLFLLFSNYDSMPCVMIEAFCCGLPVIGSAINGIEEHVKDGRGIVVPPRDEDAFCNAILRAMDSISAFDKKKISDYGEINFSYDIVAEQFDKIYQKTVA